MKNKLFILTFLTLFATQVVAQVHWTYTADTRTPSNCEYTTDYWPMTADEIKNYYAIHFPGDHYMNYLDYASFYNCGDINSQSFNIYRTVTNISSTACTHSFQAHYFVVFMCEDVPTTFEVIEPFVVKIKGDRPPYINATYPTDGSMTEADGYLESELPAPLTMEEIYQNFPNIQNSCGDQEKMSVTVQVTQGSEDYCSRIYIRTYTVHDDCLGQNIATITENVKMNSILKVYGYMALEDFTEEGTVPPAVTSIADLEKKGARINYSRQKSDLRVGSRTVDVEGMPNRKKRVYYVYNENCPTLRDSIAQYFRRKPDNLVPFSIFYTDATVEGVDDGTLEIYPPQYDEGCHDTPNLPNEWYEIYLIDQEGLTVQKFDAETTDNIYLITGLRAGDYKLNVYARCPSCDFDDRVVYTTNFVIKRRNMALYVTDGLGLFSTNKYISYNSEVRVEGPNHSYVPFAEYDPLVARFDDEWELATGKIYSPKKVEWDLYEMYNPAMGGYGQYENILWQYQMVNGEFSHGLQRMIVTKNEDHSVTYRLRKKPQRDGEGEIFLETVYPVYREELWCSNDPNEIFGPAGYTDADSVAVRMINATDDINYTIQFENDPEFATAAAARVKITCPLDEHADPASFRLGNFGFGEHVFEVPPMASYYNNRINMDSLGYWLDVTASIAVPQNEAYWIFQTIDPETGAAPIDSLGFLPVNDTLTGAGEGFVTFRIAPKAGGVIHTGDTITEQAQIIFDENETVPTNVYQNPFDAVAPTSSIVCDTTGAYLTHKLSISFNTADDAGGSGVHYVELYVNVDLKGYEKISNVEPDSVFVYPMNDGTNFEFFGLAVDYVDNKEPYKTESELSYSLGTPPYDLSLSNRSFAENDAIGTLVGDFSTFDDQQTDIFTYALVSGAESEDNSLFRIEGNHLKTNYDFRCYGTYTYNIRVRTTDITNAYLEKSFTLTANRTETIELQTAYRHLCPGEGCLIGGQLVTEAGTYYDTLSGYLGCDSVVQVIVLLNPTPVTTSVADIICYGTDYTDNGFNLSVDTLAQLTAGWTMDDNITLSIDRYSENAFGCYDTTRLALTIQPAYDFVDNVVVCPTDLPFEYQGGSFYQDTVAVFSYKTAADCDSTYTLHMTLNPDYGTQESDLTEGWNWYSTYIDQSNGRGLAELENALGGNAEMIKSKTAFVMFTPSTNLWFGSLDEINNTTMYMIKMSDVYTPSVLGCYAPIDTITLTPGWTWIGYPLTDTTGVNQLTPAIEGGPTNDDVIKSKQSFAMYYASYGIWLGLLSDLTPGTGYMYMSNSSVAKALNYNNCSRTDDVHLLEAATPHWMADHKRFADNMTMMGIITLDGQLIESDTLEVGAFVNGEERGAGRAVYIEEMDAYRIFLTIHGEEGEVVNFRLFDHSRGKERRIRCQEQVVFSPSRHYGQLENPYRFVFLTDYDKYIQAEICEGEYYTENNFRVSRQGTYFQELTTAIGNDSIVRLDLTVNPVYRVEETVVAMGFPFEYQGVVFDKPGTHVLPFKTAAACDSVWVVTMRLYEGERELLLSPQPASRSQRVNVYFPFTQQEQSGVLVEVYTLTGSLIQTKRPTRFPIELDPFTTAGTYMVKITMGTGEVITGKIIIK